MKASEDNQGKILSVCMKTHQEYFDDPFIIYVGALCIQQYVIVGIAADLIWNRSILILLTVSRYVERCSLRCVSQRYFWTQGSMNPNTTTSNRN